MFVDDLLVFGKSTREHMDYVNNILKKFCDMSGHQINKDKTKILFSKNTTEYIRKHSAHASGFKETR